VRVYGLKDSPNTQVTIEAIIMLNQLSGFRVRKNVYYYAMLLLPITYFVIFRFGPISGLIMAFTRFSPGSGLYGGDWVGLRYFELFLKDPNFWRAFRNNIALAVISVLTIYPVPIVFALLLNEVRALRFKKTIQTISYLPHFLSLVVVTGMIVQILSPSSGVVNNILERLGAESTFFLNESEWFRPIYVISEIWQHTGWNAIIFIAALAGISPQLYEAAEIDGATRFQQMRYVTLPGIRPAITITLILFIGNMMDLAFQKILLLYNPLTYETADVIQTYVYRMGIQQANFSYATAIGLFDALIGFGLVMVANWVARRFSDTSLF